MIQTPLKPETQKTIENRHFDVSPPFTSLPDLVKRCVGTPCPVWKLPTQPNITDAQLLSRETWSTDRPTVGGPARTVGHSHASSA